MTLSPGTRLGPYAILALVGRGGMGEVYRARDSRLEREVAVKVLPSAVASDPERRLRFEREARAVAALSHPNILAIHDVGLEDGVLYAVTELLEGETLRDRLVAQGAQGLPARKAIDIAVQIARGLGAAHDKSIVHRDLKPENVFLLHDGRVKILDFGLARAIPTDSGETATVAGGTDPGTVMGTVGYMAPEQIRGQAVDARTDLFALGVVLYEMLGGRRAFAAETAADTLSAILREEPPALTELRSDVSPAIERIVRHCLEKNPAERFRTASDVAFALETLSGPVSATSALGPAAPAAPAPASPRRRSWLGWATAAVMALAAGTALVVHRAPVASPNETIRFRVTPPDGAEIDKGFFAVSPDGHRLAWAGLGPDGLSHLWVRELDSFDARILPGTDKALSPFWAPDSHALGFFADGKLRRTTISSGSPEIICDAGNRGASWGADGVILFAANQVFKVPASGGTPVALTQVDPSRQELFHARPVWLPDGKHFLYVRASSAQENTGTFVGSVDAKPAEQDRTRLIGGLTGPGFTAAANGLPGRLFFLRDHQLLTQAFDANRRELSGEPSLLAEPVGDNGNAIGYFSVSPAVLVFRGVAGDAPLTWLDRQGHAAGTAGDPARYIEVELSPDATRVAGTRYGANRDIWIIDLQRGVNSRFTSDPAWESRPTWAPDGTKIIFGSDRLAGTYDLYRKLTDGSRDEEPMFPTVSSRLPLDWSRDGRYLLFRAADASGHTDLWVLENPAGPADQRKATPFLTTPFHKDQARFSPDGKWVVYASDETGRSEVYVRPFPAAESGATRQVSTTGGAQPRWSRDGRELFYIAPTGKLMSVAIDASRSFQAGSPVALFPMPIPGGAGDGTGPALWDVMPGSQRFLVAAGAADAESAPLSVVLNWKP